MHRAAFALALASLPLLSLAGCSKDDFALETMAEVDALTDELVTSIEAAEDKRAAIAEAQATLEAKRATLEPKWNRVMSLNSFQLSDDTATEIAGSMLDNTTKIALLQTQLIVESAQDPELAASLEALLDAHEALLDGE